MSSSEAAKRWVLPSTNSELIQSIAEEQQCSPLIAQVLYNRQLHHKEDITFFLHANLQDLPDPYLLKDMDLAVRRIIQAIEKGEKITIYGDYDVDGSTSTAMMVDFFKSLNAQIDYYIPHRLKEGYGLNKQAIQQLKKQGTQVIITVDNGISSVEEASLIHDLDMDLIITDHHEPPPQLPIATAILNPKQKDDSFPGKELAGVGVAFYLMIALRKAYREKGLFKNQEPNLRQALDLVAVGTIADLAPLTGINRILVREGLKVLSCTQKIGLRALMKVSDVHGKVSAGQVGFRIGPRINAVGRLHDASLGVKLLLSQNEEEAFDLAKQLNQANEKRQNLELEITEQAIEQINKKQLYQNYRSLVVFDRNWHHGVVGIVASRLVEHYHLPSIVMSQVDNHIKGSARSIRGLNLVKTLRRCEQYLESYGGHAYAAGLSLRPEKLSDFIMAFDQEVRQQLNEEDYSPAIHLDVESSLQQIEAQLLEDLSRLEPYGLGNPTPIFCSRGVNIQASRIVGENHLKLAIKDPQSNSKSSMDAIGFRMADKNPLLNSKVDLAFVPEWNEWQGEKRIQLKLIDIKLSK
ncbi:MAG: single-stranded-DNA-specific exonuclease RecJ [Deltaproteobacteria bacterium]|nr:single-stranded-DNA-specific exonuclease RecJ [Deltaproteobacteria bacterium]